MTSPRLALLAACGLLALARTPLLAAAAPVAIPANQPLVPPAPLPTADFYEINNTAHGLAGLLPVQDGETGWKTTPDWLSYKEWLDSRWSYIQRARLNAMESWSIASLGPLRAKSSTVFYPFSGPDFLYVNAFFPDSRYLLLAGLEPIGTLPKLAVLRQQGKLPAYLQAIKTSLSTILAASFFKTKDMKVDFNNQLVDGLLPDIAVFLTRQGYTIDSLQYVSLDHDGTLHLHAPAGAEGVQITYFKGDRSSLSYVCYFQTDLDDDGQKANPGFTHLMHRLGPGVTYLKAASYLLHESYFSTIRDAILANSSGVLEDDSGLPLRAFPPSQWAVSIYGNYSGPITLFHNYNQPDLLQLYATNPHPALPFGSGYQYLAEKSHLLVATKK